MDTRLTAPDTTAPSESSDRYEDIAEETEHSTSLRSSKRGHQDEEVTSKNTSSGDFILDEGHSKQVLSVPPLSSRPPPAKKIRSNAWDIEELDDDDSE